MRTYSTLLVAAAVAVTAAPARAQVYRDVITARADDVAPGTIFVSPTVDLDLQDEPVTGLEGRTLRVPPGFRVQLFARGVDKARLMAWGPDSVLYVASMSNGSSEWSPDPDTTSRVLALPDRDHDGRADTVQVAADHLYWPNDVAFYEGDMYVADTHQVLRLHDGDGDGYYEDRMVFIDSLRTWEPGKGINHVTHSILFDVAKERIYIHEGSSCDLCREADPERATIMAFDLDGSHRRVFARGLRNAIGFDLHPVTGELWAAANGHDRDRFPDGRNMPPEWVGIVREGAFYGWPLAFGFRSWVDFTVPEYRRQIFPLTHADTLKVQSIPRPVAMLPAHTAPMALHFYRGTGFPERYHNAAFIALRAGARGVSDGYKVVVLFANPDGSNGHVADFLTGFRPDPISPKMWGKPVGLQTDSQGNLYVSSDHTTQAIFRISAGPLIAGWTRTPPDSVVARQVVSGTLRVTRSAAQGETPTASVDLSAFGGPEAVAMVPLGDGRFAFEVPVPGAAAVGVGTVRVTVSQSTAQGVHRLILSRPILVLPAQDLLVLGDDLSAGWGIVASRGAEPPVFSSQGPVFQGSASAAVTAAPLRRSRVWIVDFESASGIEALGYRSLRFAFHPGDVVAQKGDRLDVELRSFTTRTVGLLEGATQDYGLDLARKAWQVVDIPLADFGPLKAPITRIRIASNVAGTIYVDDLRLVRALPSTVTVVGDADDQGATPWDAALDQNYPNPFNGQTVIPYRLSASGQVSLQVYNLTGQRVATLAAGRESAGLHEVAWNGRDIAGRPLASGVYLYRLQAGGQEQTRKLLLLR